MQSRAPRLCPDWR